MDFKQRAQAIEAFVAQYGMTPEKYGYPVIDVCAKQKKFLFGKDKEVIEARLTEFRLESFFDKAYLMPVFVVAVVVLQMIFMFVFRQFLPYFRDCVLFLVFLSICWGCFMYLVGKKLKAARKKSQEGLIEIFY